MPLKLESRLGEGVGNISQFFGNKVTTGQLFALPRMHITGIHTEYAIRNRVKPVLSPAVSVHCFKSRMQQGLLQH